MSGGEIAAGQIYRHFKDKLYQIVTVANHTETGEELVIYQALYGDFKVYARPVSMFFSKVDRKKYPNVRQENRFEYVGNAGQSIFNESNADTGHTEDRDKVKENEKDTAIISESKLESADSGLPDKDLLDFLDARTYEEKRAILVAMRPRITDRLINDIAASLDITVEEGDIERRFRSLLYCVSKMDEFEVKRLR